MRWWEKLFRRSGEHHRPCSGESAEGDVAQSYGRVSAGVWTVRDVTTAARRYRVISRFSADGVCLQPEGTSSSFTAATRRRGGDGRSSLPPWIPSGKVSGAKAEGRSQTAWTPRRPPFHLGSAPLIKRRWRRRGSDDQSKQNAASQFSLRDISATRVIPPRPHSA